MAGLILDQWQVARLRPGPVRIFPDGCQDVIWAHLPGQAPVWKAATLDPQVRWLHDASPGRLLADPEAMAALLGTGL